MTKTKKAPAAKPAKLAMQPAMDTAPIFKMTAVYHIFQQAWEQNGGKRTGFTAAQINDLLVADGGKTK